LKCVKRSIIAILYIIFFIASNMDWHNDRVRDNRVSMDAFVRQERHMKPRADRGKPTHMPQPAPMYKPESELMHNPRPKIEQEEVE